jgi:hypothetical protein
MLTLELSPLCSEISGNIIDQSHPLHGKSIAGSILCIPSGRGSCTASQVLLELILNKKAPKALVLRDRDGLVSVGALVAEAMFPEATVLDIVQLSDFTGLLKEDPPAFGQVLEDGSIVFGDNKEEVRKMALDISSSLDGSIKNRKLELTAEEEAMIASAETDAELRAFDCIIRYARIVSENPNYIDVEKAHIDGTILYIFRRPYLLFT